jgi:tetratricopeptide (TPR) repeat protein
VDATEGNPLFVEEFVSMLLDDGSVRRSGDIWVATADLSTIATPASIMALLAARLDRLPRDEIDVLKRAAVVGKVFDGAAVAALLENDDVADGDRRLGALVRREIIRPDRSSGGRSDSYRFKHILIRDAAYAAVPKIERVVLHERLADWLSRSVGEGRRPVDEVIGSHLEQAYRYRTELGPLDDRARAVGRMAAARLAAVGRRAHVRGDAGVAEGMLSRAAALLPADDRERLLLLADLTEALIERVEFESARRTTDELMESARVAGMADVTWRATLYRIELDHFANTDISQHITDSVRKAIQFFDTVGDHRALGLAWFLIGSLEMGRGHYRQGRQANERAIDHARRAGDLRAEARSMVEVAWIDLYGPATVTVARRTAQELLDWARAAGVQGTEAIALGYLGRLAAMVGEFDEARRLVEASQALSNQLGRRYLVAGNISWWMGLVDWLAGDPAAATRELRSGYEQLERLGDRTMRPEIAADLARMLYLQHRLEDAFNYTQISEAFGPMTHVTVGIGWRGVRGMILARRGEWSAAVNLAREAVATAETTDMLFYHARALEDLAEVLELSGSSDEARPVLAKAIGLYEQKGISVLAERARQRVRAAAIEPTRKGSFV